MKVKSESEVAQSCLTLSDPVYRSLPGSSVHGVFQARVLEWGGVPLPSPSQALVEGKLNDIKVTLKYVEVIEQVWSQVPKGSLLLILKL